jgi:hypothetical protein
MNNLLTHQSGDVGEKVDPFHFVILTLHKIFKIIGGLFVFYTTGQLTALNLCRDKLAEYTH